MKNKQNLGDKTPFITIDKSLNKLRNKTMFPKKLKKANEILLTARLPKNKHIS
ncbi:hypothetical protein WAF17_11395 [Bernardetia sp. ABR2-2B]|uniref:hypothetical protein n=1 Tax=Bernardetia sp. ABR2-2B TaxID=3127472 RepID=UPI0030CF4C6D